MLSSALKKIRPAIGRLNHLAWMIRFLGRLVPETGAKTVRHSRDLVLSE